MPASFEKIQTRKIRRRVWKMSSMLPQQRNLFVEVQHKVVCYSSAGMLIRIPLCFEMAIILLLSIWVLYHMAQRSVTVFSN
jgi:hypothetical protein